MGIATLLLDRGAEVDATSDAYGDGSTTLGLVATSAHPRARGVQISLIDLLLARGAPLEARNSYGGTVLSSTVWFAHHVTDDEFRRRPLLSAIELLIAESARVDSYPILAEEIRGAYARAKRLQDG